MDIKRYAFFHKALLEKNRSEQQEINNRALNSLQKLVTIFRDKPSIKKVIVFGSLINGTFTNGSDIDIAIEGVQSSDFFTLWREIEEKIGIEIDLVDLTPNNIPIYNIIQKTGRVIYEKS